MGIFDCERLSETIYPGSGNISKNNNLAYMKNNVQFVNEMRRAMGFSTLYSIGGQVLTYSDYSLYSLLNTPVFKITKNREDIFLLNASVYNVNTKKYNKFLLLVNNDSFFKRIKVYKDSNASEIYTNSNTAESVLNATVTNHLNCSFNFIKTVHINEKNDLSELIKVENVDDKSISKYGLFNGAPIKISGYYNFNKICWLLLVNDDNKFKPITGESVIYDKGYKINYLY